MSPSLSHCQLFHELTRRLGTHVCLLLTFLFGCTPEATFQIPETKGYSWYKGNTHTHTTESDGDSSPEYVANWYREQGYQFLVLSDHNVLTDVVSGPLASLNDEEFLLIPGEELSATHSTAFMKGKPIHVNGLNIRHKIDPIDNQADLAETIQANVTCVRRAGGVPHINHPNFHWAFDNRDLARVRNYRLLEMYNAHPGVNSLGGSGHPSVEEIWDRLLTEGRRVYGIASDDAHHFKGEFSPARSNPGRGWVVVRSAALTPVAILSNLEAGNFYASTGVDLTDIEVERSRLLIHIDQKADREYRTIFLGSNGAILSEVDENPAVYELSGDEPYVRARVEDSKGYVAWVQPVLTSCWKPLDRQ